MSCRPGCLPGLVYSLETADEDVLEILSFLAFLTPAGGTVKIILPVDITHGQMFLNLYRLRVLNSEMGYFHDINPAAASGAVRLTRNDAGHDGNIFTRNTLFATSARGLFGTVFGHGINEKFWAWKYGSSNGRFSVLVVSQGRVVGYDGGIPRMLRLNGCERLAVQSADVAVSDAQRGFYRSGVFNRLSRLFVANAFEQGADFLYGFPHGRAMKLGMRTGVYEYGGAIYDCVTTGELDGPALNCLSVPRDVTADSVSEDIYHNCLRRFEASLDELGMACLKRDFAYFKSRYLFHPEYCYRVLVFAELNALLVVKQEGSYLRVMDFIGDVRFFQQILGATHQYLLSTGKTGLMFWILDAWRFLIDAAQWVSVNDSSAAFAWRSKTQVSLSQKIWISCGDTDFM
ncbi:MAG: GNAT family N-acetyltransferase [Oceanospirillaceae bacterium]|nr:GNAT family N-acetyltransferase [Oceanospirillaceae bacterium]